MSIFTQILDQVRWSWEMNGKILKLGETAWAKTVRFCVVGAMICGTLWTMFSYMIRKVTTLILMLETKLLALSDGMSSNSISSGVSSFSSISDMVGVANSIFPLQESIVLIVFIFNYWVVCVGLRLSIFVYKKVKDILQIGVNLVRG